MKIKFIESHSFVGEHMSMEVDDRSHDLHLDKDQTYEQHAVKILKDVYGVNFRLEDVKFMWDGTL